MTDPNIYSSGSTTASGYTCSMCGTWVPTGQIHTCWSNNVVPFYTVYWPPEVIDYLRRIAEALEKNR